MIVVELTSQVHCLSPAVTAARCDMLELVRISFQSVGVPLAVGHGTTTMSPMSKASSICLCKNNAAIS